MAGWYVEYLVGDMPEECDHLGGHDLEAFASGWIAVDHGRVGTWLAKAMGAPDNVQARLGGAHLAGVCTAAVRESLAVVIVFLLAEAEGGEHDAFVWRRC